MGISCVIITPKRNGQVNPCTQLPINGGRKLGHSQPILPKSRNPDVRSEVSARITCVLISSNASGQCPVTYQSHVISVLKNYGGSPIRRSRSAKRGSERRGSNRGSTLR